MARYMAIQHERKLEIGKQNMQCWRFLWLDFNEQTLTENIQNDLVHFVCHQRFIKATEVLLHHPEHVPLKPGVAGKVVYFLRPLRHK